MATKIYVSSKVVTNTCYGCPNAGFLHGESRSDVICKGKLKKITDERTIREHEIALSSQPQPDPMLIPEWCPLRDYEPEKGTGFY